MLEKIAWVSIAVGIACALWIAADEFRRPQPMAVMNLVWPITGLYLSLFAVYAYYRSGRPKAEAVSEYQWSMHAQHPNNDKQTITPTAAQVFIGTSHCGAGCVVADMVCEFGIAATTFTVLGSVLLTEYLIDFAAAWTLGIVFQYFAIRPMRNLTVRQAVVAAVKADTLSIIAFQVGMYAWMALVFFKLFPHPHLTAFQPEYWLMMQLAMALGFATALPMNWWLIKTGIKEAM